MPLRITRTLRVAAPLLGIVVATLAAAADEPSPLDRAQTLLEQDHAREAVEVLESALPTVLASERPALLDLLRRGYRRAAEQAEAEGQTLQAEVYRDNLRILDRRPTKPEAGSDRPPGHPPEPPGSPGAEPEPLPPPEVVAPPLPPGSPAPAAGDAEDEDESIPPPLVEPESVRNTLDLQDPEPTATPRGSPLSSSHAHGSAEVPASAQPSRPQIQPEPQRDPETDRTRTAADLAAADTAFAAGRYDEAGRHYAELARRDQLPRERFDHWAYCRACEVARRINAQPRTAEEWAEIQREIQTIRTLSPDNWIGEYLRNLAIDRSSRGRSGPARPVLRGSAPEEALPSRTPSPVKPSPARATPPESTGPPSSSSSPSARPRTDTLGQPAPPIGPWKVWETTNFRIFAADEDLARQVAPLAEQARDAQVVHWNSRVPQAPWLPRCDIYLYPDAATFHWMTGQPEDSPGFSTMGLQGGRVIARRVNLRADHPNLLEAILPHEITHVVLADLFPSQQIPRWADEGMAVLAEPHEEQQRRAADLIEPLSQGRIFALRDLMAMDYPDGPYWGLYYAQSVSLTRFLVERETPAQFIEFLQASQRNGIEPELRRIYGFDGFDDLQEQWLAFARATFETANASANAPGEPARLANRSPR